MQASALFQNFWAQPVIIIVTTTLLVWVLGVAGLAGTPWCAAVQRDAASAAERCKAVELGSQAVVPCGANRRRFRR